MGIQPTSFLIGLGAAYAAPFIARVFRPFAVQAAVAGMGIFDEVRRVIAEQAELMEDIVAEARARREEMDSGDEDPEATADTGAASPAPERARRRSNGAVRRRAS